MHTLLCIIHVLYMYLYMTGAHTMYISKTETVWCFNHQNFKLSTPAICDGYVTTGAKMYRYVLHVTLHLHVHVHILHAHNQGVSP